MRVQHTSNRRPGGEHAASAAGRYRRRLCKEHRSPRQVRRPGRLHDSAHASDLPSLGSSPARRRRSLGRAQRYRSRPSRVRSRAGHSGRGRRVGKDPGHLSRDRAGDPNHRWACSLATNARPPRGGRDLDGRRPRPRRCELRFHSGQMAARSPRVAARAVLLLLPGLARPALHRRRYGGAGVDARRARVRIPACHGVIRARRERRRRIRRGAGPGGAGTRPGLSAGRARGDARDRRVRAIP